jgi:hypothetical protein
MESTTVPAKQRKRTTLLALPYNVVVDIVGVVAATSMHPSAYLSSIAATYVRLCINALNSLLPARVRCTN